MTHHRCVSVGTAFRRGGTWTRLAATAAVALWALGGGARAATLVYPSGADNSRVPVVAPVDGGAKGKAIPFERVVFTYAFAPCFVAGAEGSVVFQVRDLNSRLQKPVLELADDAGRKIEVDVPPASVGRGLALRFGQKFVVSPQSLPLDAWREIRLVYGHGKATLTGEGTPLDVAIPADFVPTRLSLHGAMTDETVFTSNGATLTADWEDGYAARVDAGAQPGGIGAELMGFDSHVVSLDPARRDCPMVHVVNTTDREGGVDVAFSLVGETSGRGATWTQKVSAPARSFSTVPVAFPKGLDDGIFHLTATVTGAGDAQTVKKHFLYAARRGEMPGPGLFGLHDSDAGVFGFWPDALPLRLSHKYLYWGYVVGPAWLKDWNGQYGLDPATPSKEWHWNHKIDWELLAGRELYVCLRSVPLLDWQRARPYEGMRRYAWGQRGGFPDLAKYAEFVKAAGERYRGRVLRWEAENEPNSSHEMNKYPLDYAEVAKTVGKALKAVSADNVVYGISGTSTFVPWMEKALEAGAAEGLDAVSWHSYTTPEQPDRAGLAAMLRDARAVGERFKLSRYLNSETGVLLPQRYEVGAAIPAEIVAKRIEEKHPAFVSRGAWPGRVNTEWQAAASIVKNAGINFLAGAEAFVFFGWNPEWPKNPAQWENTTPGFGLFVATAEGERTPSLAALAVAVMTTQFEGVLTTPAPRPVAASGIDGGFFNKADGTEVALLWSTGSIGSALLGAEADELEVVSLFGRRERIKPFGQEGVLRRFLLPLSDQPCYVHAPSAGMGVMPSPVERIRVSELRGGKGSVRFTLLNRGAEPWVAKVNAPAVRGVTFDEPSRTAEVDPKKRRNLDFAFTVGPDAAREIALPFAVELPGGGEYVEAITIENRPTIAVASLKDAVKLDDPEALARVGSEMRIDRAEQAVVGGPSPLASLQESHFWGGPEELSASVRLAADATALYVSVRVRDANLKAPKAWPGTDGGVVELFFDFRPVGKGLGSAGYGQDVYQLLLAPGLDGKDPLRYVAQKVKPEFELAGKALDDKSYFLHLRLPWKSVTKDGAPPETFGFDAVVNGSYPDKPQRKTQLALFGTAQNWRNASAFGQAVLPAFAPAAAPAAKAAQPEARSATPAAPGPAPSPAAAVKAPVTSSDGIVLRPLVESTARNGLPNFYAKLRAGKPVKIGYLGGSITSQPGWRVFSREYFQKLFPDAKVSEIHAAIGGTGSNLGVFRLERDVLRHKPDLVFVEFAVNDAGARPQTIQQAMEGIVRQTWRTIPDCDIAFVYTLTANDIATLSKGTMQRSASVMETVADHYGIPSIHMGAEIAAMEGRGEVLMRGDNAGMTRVSGTELDALADAAKTPDGKIPFSKDGVHPYPDTGHRLYMASLLRSLPEIAKAGTPGPHALGEALADNWEYARMYPLSRAKLKGFERLPAGEGLGKQFGGRMPEVWKALPGAELSFRFKGTKAEIYDVYGPDSGKVRVQLDDRDPVTLTRMDSYCTYHRLAMMNVAHNVPDGEHSVTVTVLDEPLDKVAILKPRKNDGDLEKNPAKYEGIHWYAGALLVVGEVLD